MATTYNLTSFGYPGAISTQALGINDSGEIVPIYANVSNGTDNHGFLKVGDAFTSITYPGAKDTRGCGINDSGDIVGFINGDNLLGYLKVGGHH